MRKNNISCHHRENNTGFNGDQQLQTKNRLNFIDTIEYLMFLHTPHADHQRNVYKSSSSYIGLEFSECFFDNK